MDKEKDSSWGYDKEANSLQFVSNFLEAVKVVVNMVGSSG